MLLKAKYYIILHRATKLNINLLEYTKYGILIMKKKEDKKNFIGLGHLEGTFKGSLRMSRMI